MAVLLEMPAWRKNSEPTAPIQSQRGTLLQQFQHYRQTRETCSLVGLAIHKQPAKSRSRPSFKVS